MKDQSLLHKKLNSKEFIFTAETTPPDSADKNTLLEKIKPLIGVADAINVTDSPGANVHMSSLTAAIILAQNNVDPILQITVRDRNRLALQGDLLGASALGVHNILCLSGDDPKKGDQPETKLVNDISSLTLAKTANLMRNENKFPSGRIIDSAPNIFIGGAEAPTKNKPDIEKILNKIKSGVDFFQTQYVFDTLILKNYMKILEDSGIIEKVFFIIGLGPFASAKSAIWMNKNLYGVNIPENIIKRLEQANDAKKESKNICLELTQEFKEIKGVSGVHFMGHKKESLIAEIITHAKK